MLDKKLPTVPMLMNLKGDSIMLSRVLSLRHVLTAVALIICAMANSHADVVYSSILNFNNSVSGVRGITTNSVNPDVIYTGSYVTNGSVFGLLYQGTLQGTGTSYTSIQPTPLVGSGTLSGSLFYGPNTPVFDALVGSSNIMAVGTFQTNGSLKDSGMLFQGNLSTGVPLSTTRHPATTRHSRSMRQGAAMISQRLMGSGRRGVATAPPM